MLFKNWWSTFYKVCCQGSISYDSCVEYKIIYDKHFIDLYDMELEEIKPIHIRACIQSAFSYLSAEELNFIKKQK